MLVEAKAIWTAIIGAVVGAAATEAFHLLRWWLRRRTSVAARARAVDAAYTALRAHISHNPIGGMYPEDKLIAYTGASERDIALGAVSRAVSEAILQKAAAGYYEHVG